MAFGEIIITFDIVCKECGENLEVIEDGKHDILRIVPCPCCIEEAHDNGYNEGLEDGRDERDD